MKNLLTGLAFGLACFCFGDPTTSAAHAELKAKKTALLMYSVDSDQMSNFGTDVACVGAGAGAVGLAWYGEDHFGASHRPKTISPTPEPAGFAVLLVALAGLVRRRRTTQA